MTSISLYQKYQFKEVGRRKKYGGGYIVSDESGISKLALRLHHLPLNHYQKYYQNKENAIIMTTPTLNSEAYLALFKLLKDTLFQRLENFWLLV